MLARVEGRSGFNLGGFADYQDLPLDVRDAMLEWLDQWKAQEDAALREARRGR